MRKQSARGRTWTVALTLGFIVLFTTCKNNVGLGGTIDINPPTISTSSIYPPIGAVIKGPFTIAVQADDDTGVQAVTVTITNTVLGGSAPEGDAGFFNLYSKDGVHWEKDDVNKKGEKGFPIKDGSYKAQILAVDSAGRETRAERAFIIDNTPPLLILDRPSTATENPDESYSVADAFGDGFWLIGQVYDANPVAKLTIEAQSVKSGSTVYTTELKNIPQNIRLKVDAFSQDGERKFYRALYEGDETSGKQNFRYKIRVYDEAKNYNGSGTASGEGNYSDVHYLRADLYDQVLNKYKIQQVYAALYGDAISVTAEEAVNIKRELDKPENKLGAGQRVGTFALNPALNPHFEIAGKSPIPKPVSGEPDFPDYYVNTSFRVKLSQNLDEVPLKTIDPAADPHDDPYQFYLVPWSIYSGFPAYYDVNEDTDKTGFIQVYREKTGDKSGLERDGGDYFIDLLTEVVPGRYVLLVQGADRGDNGGNKFIADRKGISNALYGIHVIKAGDAPTVSVTEINTQDPESSGKIYVKKNGSIAFKTKVNKHATVYYQFLDGTGADTGYGMQSYELGSVSHPALIGGPAAISASSAGFASTGGSYRLQVWARDTDGHESSKQVYHIGYDVVGPEVRIITPAGSKINQDEGEAFDISGSVFDAGVGVRISSPIEKITIKRDGTVVKTLNSTDSLAFEQNGEDWKAQRLNLSDYGEGEYELTVSALDALEQKKDTVKSFIYDKVPPEITGLKAGNKEVTESGDTVYIDKDYSEPFIKIGVKAQDSYGIKTVKIGIDNNAPYDAGFFWHNADISSWAAGRHNVRVTVTDKADKSANATIEFFVDRDVPSFSVLKIGGVEYSSGTAGTPVLPGTPEAAPVEIQTYQSPVTLEGTVTDSGSGVEKVEYSLNAAAVDAEWTLLTLKKSGAGYTFNGYVAIEASRMETVTLRITDKAGNTANWGRPIKVLSEIPEFDLKVQGASGDGTPIRKGPFTIELGCYVDNAPGTKVIDDIIVKKGSTVIADKNMGFDNFFAGWNPTSMLKVTAKTPKAPTDYTVKAGLESGEYTVTLKEKGITRTGTVIIDETGPVIDLVNPVPDAKHTSGDSKDNWAKQHLFGKLVISGSFTDTPAAMNLNTDINATDPAYTCRIGKDKKPLLSTDKFKLSGTSTWLLEITSAEKYCEDDTYVLEKYNSENEPDPINGKVFKIPLYITAKDKLGNKTEQAFYIMIASDGKMPQLTIVSPPQAAPSAAELAQENPPPVYNGRKVITVGGLIGFSGLSQTLNPAAGQIRKIYVRFSNNDQLSGSFNREFNGIVRDLSVPNGIEAASGSNLMSWQFTVDSEKFLGTAEQMELYYTVQAENNEGTKSSWTPVRKIMLDKKAPYFKDRKIQKGISEIPDYANNILVKDGDMLICDLLSTSDIGKIEVTSETAGASYLAPLASLSGSAIAGAQIDGHAVFERIPGAANASRGYKMKLPIMLAGLSDPNQIFSIKVKLTDAKTGNDQKLNFDQFNVKYDKTKPAVVFGKAVGKFGMGNFTKSGTSVQASGIEAAAIGMDKKDLFVFVETKDGSAETFAVTGTGDKTISFTAPAHTQFDATSAYILLRKDRLVFDPSSDYQVEGFTYDTGSGVKEVKATIAGADVTVTAFTGELGNFSSFKESFKTFDIADGEQTLRLLVSDKAGNNGVSATDTVYLRNHPLRISKVHFKTDLDYGGDYENIQNRGLVEIVAEGGSDRYLNDKKNYVQTLDIHTRFAFKNAGKSQIAFELEGGKGTIRTYEVYAVDVHGNAIDGTKHKRGTLADNAGQKIINLSQVDFDEPNPVFPEGSEKKFAIVLRDEASPMNPGTGSVTGDTDRKLTLIVTVGVKTADNRKPQIVILPFYWNSEGDNSLAGHKRENGHIEIASITGLTDNPSDDNVYPSVSGKVTLRGTAYHPARLTELQLTVPNTASSPSSVTVKALYNSSGWVASPPSPPPPASQLKVTDERIDVNGHWVAWEYVWDTGAPAVNQDITAVARHNAIESDSTEIGSTASKQAQARSDAQSLKLQAGDTVVVGQFLRLVKDEQSYLVTVNRVNDDGNVEWRLTNVPQDVRDYYLYPVYKTDEFGYNKPVFKVNIVPYITGIETPLSDSDETLTRSALGAYPVARGSSFKLHGFNITSVPEITLGSKVFTVGTPANSDGSYNVTIPNDVVSDFLTVKIGGIRAINNINCLPVFAADGTVTKAAYNVQSTLANKRLTDDVKLSVWEVSDFKAGMSKGLTDPMLKIAADSKWYMSYGKGATDMIVNTNGTETKIDQSYSMFHNTAVAYDTDGNIYAAATNTDRIEDWSAKFSFYSRIPSTLTPAFPTPAPQACDHVITIEKFAHGLPKYKYGFGARSYQLSWKGKSRLEKVFNQGQYNTNRVSRPKMAVAGDTAKAEVYMSYFDANHPSNPVKFRYGTIDSSNDFDGGIKDGGTIRVHTVNSVSVTDAEYHANALQGENGSAAGYHIIADNATTTHKSGAYTAVGIVPKGKAGTTKDVAVVAWYDAAAKNLVYSYNKDPDVPVQGGAWQSNARVVDADPTSGWYVDLTVDEKGGIHIGYYNNRKSELRYVYLSRYDDTAPKKVTVDSYQSVGTQITVTTRKQTVSGNEQIVPYISYYQSAFYNSPNSVRVAWRTDFTELKDGAKNDLFTGAWEAMTIPVQDGTIPQDATICNGVPTSGIWANTVVLGFMTNDGYKKAVLKK